MNAIDSLLQRFVVSANGTSNGGLDTPHVDGEEEEGSFYQLMQHQREVSDPTQQEEAEAEQTPVDHPQGQVQPDVLQLAADQMLVWGWLAPGDATDCTQQIGQGQLQMEGITQQPQLLPGQRAVEQGTAWAPQSAADTAAQPVHNQATPSGTAVIATAAENAGECGQTGQTGQEGASFTQTHQQQAQAPVPQVQSSGQTEEGERQQVTVNGWQRPLFGPMDAIPVPVGDAAVDLTAPAQQVETQMANLIRTSMSEGGEHLEIKLQPEQLGTVVVEFDRTPEGVLHVVLHAESEQAAKLLGDHASALGALLQDSNQGQAYVEVTHMQQSYQESWQQMDQNSGHRQGQQQHQRQTPHSDPESFAQQLRLGLVEMDGQ